VRGGAHDDKRETETDRIASNFGWPLLSILDPLKVESGAGRPRMSLRCSFPFGATSRLLLFSSNARAHHYHLSQLPNASRLATRVSPHQMTTDPLHCATLSLPSSFLSVTHSLWPVIWGQLWQPIWLELLLQQADPVRA